jgi:hypothetical protein
MVVMKSVVMYFHFSRMPVRHSLLLRFRYSIAEIVANISEIASIIGKMRGIKSAFFINVVAPAAPIAEKTIKRMQKRWGINPYKAPMITPFFLLPLAAQQFCAFCMLFVE